MKFYVDKDEMYPVYSLLPDDDSYCHLPAIELSLLEYSQYLAAEQAYYRAQRLIETKLHED